MDVDWQNNLTAIKDRGQYLLQTEKWADCRFLVGTSPNHRIIAGHKLLLAMGSPVFERMFFGNLPDKTDPIVIPDVQPEAFEAMMEYIYTDRITIGSFDKACELCYVAKKYMLPHVVTRCTHFLWADLSPKNACRAYEFAKLFDEPRIMQSSMDLIATNTREVLLDPSFMDIEVSTLMAILDQNRLNIDSELDLFNCLLKFASERGILNESGQPEGLYISGDKEITTKQSPDHSTGDIMVEEIKMEPDVAAMVQHMHQDDDGDSFEADPNGASTSSAAAAAAATASPDANSNADADTDADAAASDDVVIIESDASGNALDDEVNMINIMDAQRTIMDGAMLRQAVKKIRFLTMTPQQFAERPARSKLLASTGNGGGAAPAGPNNVNENEPPAAGGGGGIGGVNGGGGESAGNQHNDMVRAYCTRSLTRQFDYRNTSVTDAGVTFQVDTNIWILGVQVPTRVLCGELMTSAGFTERYNEVLYAHIQDMHGSRITYTHCTARVRYDSLLDITFDRPVYIYRNQIYKIYVVFNKTGWYPMYSCVPDANSHRVKFMFNVGNPTESVRDGLIYAIIFFTPQDHSRHLID
ncbi:GL12915 [Drosophila persimilis]|uniref:GL12915 n=1 Tax=Drosophila persimilis TaxID=7234 RepID=B4GV28_DROPE|nr:GL12915 [Drosophila persimilis]